MNVDVVSEAGSVSSSGVPSCSSHLTHQHHSPYATISSLTSPSSSNAPLLYTVNNSSSSSSSRVPSTHNQSQEQHQQHQQQRQQQNILNQVSSSRQQVPGQSNYSTSSLIHSAVASALSVPLAGTGRLPYPLVHRPASSQIPPPVVTSGTSGVSDNSSSQLIQDILVRSVLRQMSHQETAGQAINWKRLHLSKGKLKASSRTSALLSGFAMVAMVEVQLCDNQKHPIPFALLIAFAVCTTLLVSVHMLALMISTCILPNVEAVASMQGLIPIIESPHDKLSYYVEIAWIFSTVLGILLFMIEVILLCWVKFWEVQGSDGRVIAWIATTLLLPIITVFIGFAVHFYRNIVAHQYERSAKGLEELQVMVSQLQSDRMANQETDQVTTANVASQNAFESSSRLVTGEATTSIGVSTSATITSVANSQATSLTLTAGPSHVPGDQMSLLASDPLSSHFHDPSVIHT